MQVQGVLQYLIGYSYISLSVTYVAGNLLARKLMQGGRSSDEILYLGYKLEVLGGILLLLGSILFPRSFFSCISAVSLLTLGNGFLLPLATGGAITSVPGLAGSASGFMGALQIASAAVTTAYIGQFSHHQPGRFGIIIFIIVIIGFSIFQLTCIMTRTTQGG
ncbi:Transport protein [Liberibacter crescens BT-1]|uniref:Transport protein n=1 Tax=Liberibacter crescens (strain BT-1) TaxID=1215343 RepID=L0EVG8_LIBCB|nr:hypothetical protein [Liberibacter crescens]AGA64658.1 Transport protein [Liberibacter crescens BT-1]